MGRSLTRMHQLIDQALAEVNLEAHVPLQPRRLNAARFLCELKEAVVSERGIAVKTEVDEMLELHIDERLMTSALTNLLQNGVKFSRAGGTVVLRIKHFTPPNLVGWEDKDKAETFRYVGKKNGAILFEGLTYQPDGDRGAIIYVATKKGEELEFKLTRSR